METTSEKDPWHFASSEKYFETASANIFTRPYTPGGPLLLHCDGRPIVERPEMTTPNIKARKTSTWYALPKNLGKRIKRFFHIRSSPYPARSCTPPSESHHYFRGLDQASFLCCFWRDRTKSVRLHRGITSKKLPTSTHLIFFIHSKHSNKIVQKKLSINSLPYKNQKSIYKSILYKLLFCLIYLQKKVVLCLNNLKQPFLP